jgi:hypothetical protein
MHPKKLEMDEAQDYPEPGWVELGETLKYGEEDATWRAHGVSRGVRDRYYKQTQPESGWFVHRVTAMHRPDWTSEERDAKAELYGSRDHPDYRRNILGLHGDAQSSLFVLVRLMACVDQNQNSRYNTDEYTHIRISDERMKDTGLPVTALLDFPEKHKSYGRVWAGADIGMTNHPTEVLIFGEERGSFAGKSHGEGFRLKLLTRIHLERISAPDQRAVFNAVWDFYRPQAIAMDRTGLGLPIYSEIKEARIPGFSDALKGYNFSEKVTIGFETDDDYDPEYPNGAPVTANVLEYSSDMLRLYVDRGEMLLPWDIDLIREFQGQTYVINKSSTDHYGRKQFNKGKFHALDGARMAILAYRLQEVDRMIAVTVESDPVLDSFIPFE